MTSATVDETALAIPKRQGSLGITIVNSQRKFIFDSHILPILILLTESTLQTGSKGHFNFQISPRHLASLRHVRIWFGSYSLEYYIKPRATAVI